MNSLKLEFDDGWRGSKVTFGKRVVVNFAFVSEEEASARDLDQVIGIMISLRKKGRPLHHALGLNGITMMAQRYHDDHIPTSASR